MKTAIVLSLGCPESRIDAACVQEFLKSNGWSITDSVSTADLILFSCCGLLGYSEELSNRMIKRLKSSQKNGSRLIVYGCLTRVNPESIRSVYDDVSFESDDLSALASLINVEEPLGCHSPNYLVSEYNLPRTMGSRIREAISVSSQYFVNKEYRKYYSAIDVECSNTHYIKVSTGCLNSCSYCGVKLSRGTLRSKPIEKVIEEFKVGLERHFTKFALIGTDVGCYGRDQKTNLVQLLHKLVDLPGDYEILIRNVNPEFLIEMLPDFVKVCRSGKIGFLGAAAQSGNNRILQLMQRRYRIEDYKHAVNALKKEFPHIKIRNGVIVGFPGETETEFEDTVQLIDEVDFDFMETNMFSPRPGTKAYSLPGALPRAVIQKRYWRILRKTVQHLRHKCPSIN
jgi:MiaB/RimO family radical SAM methylthiotransferase